MAIAPYPSRTTESFETFPTELLELRERLQAQSREVRAELEPLVVEAMEEARFRSRVLSVARDALEQFKLDLDVARFDLDATRREREELLRLLEHRFPVSDNDEDGF